MNLSEEVDLYVANLPKVDTQGNKLDPPAKGEIEKFRLICERTGLSPVTRQIYLIPRGDRATGKTAWTPQTSIDGFRAIAFRQPGYKGQTAPEWTTGPDQPWSDIPPEGEAYACKIGVYLDGAAGPTWGVIRVADYRQRSPLWRNMEPTMSAKCAESLALRKAFPVAMAGLYTAEEMAQADDAEPGGAGRPRRKRAERVEEPIGSQEPRYQDPQYVEWSMMITQAENRATLKDLGRQLEQLTDLNPETRAALLRNYKARAAQMPKENVNG